MSDLLSNDLRNISFYLKVETGGWHAPVQRLGGSAAGDGACVQGEVRGHSGLPRFLPLEEMGGFKAEI